MPYDLSTMIIIILIVILAGCCWIDHHLNCFSTTVSVVNTDTIPVEDTSQPNKKVSQHGSYPSKDTAIV